MIHHELSALPSPIHSSSLTPPPVISLSFSGCSTTPNSVNTKIHKPIIVIRTLAIQWQFSEVLRLTNQYLPPPSTSQNNENDSDNDIQWDTSIETPYEDWITTDTITEEFVQLHLNRPFMEDGADWLLKSETSHLIGG